MTKKIKIQQFLFGKNHSWSIVSQNIGRSLIKLNHQVDFISTDGLLTQFTPEDLKPFIKPKADDVYDCQISYTAPQNFPHYLSNGTTNRFGIWCYEFAPFIPNNFAKYHTFVDQILAPSTFAKEIFVSSSVPEDKIKVIPHGVNLDLINSAQPYPLKTKKQFKFLMVIGQPHSRKRIKDAIESFYKAFSIKDDVCLVARLSSAKKLTSSFEIDVNKTISELNQKYVRHPEIELINSYIPNIYSLHKSCQFVYTLTYAEGFYIPALDGIYCNNIVIAPKYGGHLDFCNTENSILIDGKKIKAPLSMQYYQGNPQNCIFEADCNLAIENLQYCYHNYDTLINKFKPNFIPIVQNYTWDKVASSIMDLYV